MAEITNDPSKLERLQADGLFAPAGGARAGGGERPSGLVGRGVAERLLQITSALADAVTAPEVFAAIVDRVCAAVEASSAALWLVDDDGRAARLARAIGYAASSAKAFEAQPLEGSRPTPAIDALRRGEPVWIASQAALVRAYPHLAAAVTAGRAYRVSCLPLVSNGRTLGVLGLTIEEEREATEEERSFLLLVARYASQAIERLRMFEAEHRLRAEADAAAARMSVLGHAFQQLYRFAHAAVSAERIEEVFDAALDAIEGALGTDRAAILLFDEGGVMRFRAWRRLSDGYRRTVEGHSPWPRDAAAPQPVLVPDVDREPSLRAYAPMLRDEGIGALAFIPLVTRGRLLGKFMVYHAGPHVFSTSELELASAIANHLASVASRFAAVAELEQTIRDNELFAGVLAHDLRNPLGAMMTAAQLVLMRLEGEGDRNAKPLSRILSSGQRMSRMIDQLLDFTRARAGGGIAVQPRETNLADLCSQAIGELELVYPDRKIRCDFDGDQGGDWDPDRLLQIISNLVANAAQHGRPGSDIHVRVDGRAAEALLLEIHNEGAIPPALLQGLFDPFRVTRHRRDHSRGLGLGLFIVKELVRAHGGTVEVASSEEAGTTFTVRLPRRRAREADAGPAPAVTR
ncbi:MAG TPA: GAF domain-containing sensor histidine kinase [Kofleriaceae bacterium]|nr:GAF domain-containing sensor histidine kinase [Kofleriaceae bacterium]